MEFSVRSNVKEIERSLDDLRRRQLPFATSVALNKMAFGVREAEVENMESVFDGVTPFTAKGNRVEKSTKYALTATVYVADRQAAYLEPFEAGSPHFLGNKRALIVPYSVKTNAYGNIPRNALRGVKASGKGFVGSVATKKGRIGGYWQRVKKGKGAKGLRLMARFEDNRTVTQRLNYQVVAKAKALAMWPSAMSEALDQAIASAK